MRERELLPKSPEPGSKFEILTLFVTSALEQKGGSGAENSNH